MDNKEKNENKEKKGLKEKYKFTSKDIVIIVLSILALICLVFIIYITKKDAKETEKNLNAANEADVSEETEDTGILKINEVNAEGWIEFYNEGKKPIDLSGTTVYIGDTLAGTAADKSSADAGKLFVLDLDRNPGENESNVVTVYKADGTREISLLVPKLDESESYGSLQDGGTEKGILTSTKGKSNNDAAENTVSSLTFSAPGGFYNKEFQLRLEAPEGSTIYYTVDGTAPTTDSDVYSAPIAIKNRTGSDTQYAAQILNGNYVPSSVDMGTVVQAIAVGSDGTQSDVMTQTYFVEIGMESEYQDVPVLEITSNPDDLFGYYDGIYVAGRSREDAIAKGLKGNSYANYYNGWVRPAHIEYYEADKGKTYEGNVSIQMAVDYTISSQQKSFYITGDGAFEGSSLADYFNQTSKSLMVQTNQYDNNYKLRDYLADDLLKDSAAGTPDITPCIVFIDGEYWGCYMLQAPYDQEYFEEHYDIPQDQKVETAVIGEDYDSYYELYHYVQTTDLSSDANYEKLESMMDMQSYMDYLCANMYLGNWLFGTDHATIWRTEANTGSGYADGKWRWIFGNMQNTMANGQLGEYSTASIDTYLEPYFDQNSFVQSLLENETFREQLAKTMNTMAETTFKAENVQEVLTSIAEKNKKLDVSNYHRFFGDTADNFYSLEVNKIQDFFDNRADYILKYTDEVVKEGGHIESAVDESVLAEGNSKASTAQTGSSQDSNTADQSDIDTSSSADAGADE